MAPNWKIPKAGLLILAFLISLEVGVWVWRNVDTRSSSATVFYWPEAETRFGKSPSLAPAIAAYDADRGAEISFETLGEPHLKAFYFEWDNVAAGPVINLGGHSPDECNLALGYKLLEIGKPKKSTVAGQESLVFDYTRFADQRGDDVYIFKMAWIQGLGSWELRVGEHRMERLRRSFINHSGAARVVQAGVFGAKSHDEAWALFQRHVLENFVWKTSLTKTTES